MELSPLFSEMVIEFEFEFELEFELEFEFKLFPINPTFFPKTESIKEKGSMKQLGIILILFSLSCLSCHKDKSPCPKGLEAGRIIGMDFRKCLCCSGWFIEIGNDTLRSFTLPDNIDIDVPDLVNPFSVPVCLSYEKAEDCQVFGDLIEIDEMILQE